jgi:Flp pilus assembly protein TadG
MIRAPHGPDSRSRPGTSRPGPHRPGRPGARREDGHVTAFVVVMMSALLLVAGLVLDGGLALMAKVRAINEAQEAARAGAQQLDLATYRGTGGVVLVPDRAAAAARTYLAATGNPDAASAVVTVTGNRVAVTVTRHQRTQLLSMLGLGSLTVTGRGEAVAAHGVEGPRP